MELLCIKTHSRRAVIAGNTYHFISDNCPCGCKAKVDVGLTTNITIDIITRALITTVIGTLIQCINCKVMYEFDGIWWIDKTLFANIATHHSEIEEDTIHILKQYKSTNYGNTH